MAGSKQADLFERYKPDGFYCEALGTAEQPARHTGGIVERLSRIGLAELRRRARDAELELYNFGVTFTVYSDRDQIDRILPFDVIPRVISAAEWARIERGCIQRVTAINAFIADVYGKGRILKAGVLPPELVLKNPNYRPEMRQIKVPAGTYAHISGIDLVRDEEGSFRVLEDNARTPSGVSYVVENRHLMQRAFPDLMNNVGVRPVSNYGQRLLESLSEVAPGGRANPSVVLLSPGTYNSAYFEHIFLAREMGVPLVEGRDLTVGDDDRVYMRTIGGAKRVDVIYRRVSDDFIDPEVFNPDSMLGAPGLMRAFARRKVTLCNAVGTGFADDKAVYAYMPRVIRYYLGEEPILPNVETYICREPEGLAYTLAHMKDLVVKPVGESGGYGITVGPLASRAELAAAREKLKADPANWISQPMVKLSVCPTLTARGVEPRHVDLRPFVVTGRSTWVLPGGLTRVALQRGSIVVNSSQGGGSKDTWVLE